MRHLVVGCVAACLASGAASAQDFTYRTALIKGSISTNPRGFGAPGQIIGYEATAAAGFEGFIATASGVTPVRVPGSQLTELDGYANGLYVGSDTTISTTAGFAMTLTGARTPIVFPGSGSTQPRSINASGTVVGTYAPTSAGSGAEALGFVLANGVYSSVQVPGSFDTELNGINAAGVMVGAYRLQGSANFSGMIIRNGVRTDVNVPGAIQTLLTGINTAGMVVGYYQTSLASGYLGFTYDGTDFRTVAPSGFSSTYAFGINDAGQVVGFGIGSKTDLGYIATPVIAR